MAVLGVGVQSCMCASTPSISLWSDCKVYSCVHVFNRASVRFALPTIMTVSYYYDRCWCIIFSTTVCLLPLFFPFFLKRTICLLFYVFLLVLASLSQQCFCFFYLLLHPLLLHFNCYTKYIEQQIFCAFVFSFSQKESNNCKESLSVLVVHLCMCNLFERSISIILTKCHFL